MVNKVRQSIFIRIAITKRDYRLELARLPHIGCFFRKSNSEKQSSDKRLCSPHFEKKEQNKTKVSTALWLREERPKVLFVPFLPW